MDCVGVAVPLLLLDPVAFVVPVTPTPPPADTDGVEMGEKSLTELVRREIVFSAGVAAF